MNTRDETSLVYLVEKWMQAAGYETRLEFQWRPKARTDLAGRRDDEFVAVEVKVHNWRRALDQALCQGKAFDRVYIAAVYRPDSQVLKEILTDTCGWSNWVGVLGIDGDVVRVLREARPKPGVIYPTIRAMVSILFHASSREGQVPYRPRTNAVS